MNLTNTGMGRFIIVRHGQTKGTETQRYYGRTDMPLTKTGVDQIGRVRKNLNGCPVDYIYTSPLRRCMQTAEILRWGRYVPIEISRNIVEIDFGSWEGLTIPQMKKRNPKRFNNWLYDFTNFKMPNGESVRDMIKRVEKFWRNIIDMHNEGTILIVTHGGPAKVIIMNVLGLPMKNFWHLHVGTGSVSVIESFNNIPMVKAINLWGRLF